MSDSRLRLFAWVGLALAGVIYLTRLDGWVLQDPDEGRYAEISREMVELDDWVTPRLNYVKYFEKPPLLYWLVGLSYKVFGESEGAARLVPALGGLATLLIVYRLGMLLAGRRAGLVAAALLATSPLFFVLAQTLVIDGLLTLCFTATMGAIFAAHRAEDKRGWCTAAAVATAFGVLAKGLVALVLPGAIALIFLLRQRDFATLRALLRPAPLAGFAIVAVPWFVLASLRNPEFLHIFFVREHFERFASDNVGHPEGPFFFLPVLLWSALPWTLLAAVLATSKRARAAMGEVAPDARWLLLLWALGVVVFFSIGSSKLPPYILPALPPLALLAGAWLDRVLDDAEVMQRGLRAVAWCLGAVGVVLVIGGLVALAFGGLAAPRFDVEPGDVRSVGAAAVWGGLGAAVSALLVLSRRDAAGAPWPAFLVLVLGFGVTLFGAIGARGVAKTSHDLARAIVRESDAGDRPLVVSYRRLMQSLSFYTRGRVTMLDPHASFNEITDSAKAAPDYTEYFWTDLTRLRTEWSSKRKVFVATDARMVAELAAVLAPPPRILARDGRRVLLVNFPAAGGSGAPGEKALAPATGS